MPVPIYFSIIRHEHFDLIMASFSLYIICFSIEAFHITGELYGSSVFFVNQTGIAIVTNLFERL